MRHLSGICMSDGHHKTIDFCDAGHIISASTKTPAHKNNRSIPMKLRAILKSMWETYCKTFKDVPPGAMF